MSTNTIEELKALISQTKKVRAKAITELRSMSDKDRAKLDNSRNLYGNVLTHKVFNYPSDLSLTRLVALLERAKELKL